VAKAVDLNLKKVLGALFFDFRFTVLPTEQNSKIHSQPFLKENQPFTPISTHNINITNSRHFGTQMNPSTFTLSSPVQ
jgi:hypothetical protein